MALLKSIRSTNVKLIESEGRPGSLCLIRSFNVALRFVLVTECVSHPLVFATE